MKLNVAIPLTLDDIILKLTRNALHLINDVILGSSPQHVRHSSIHGLFRAAVERLQQQPVPPELQPVWISTEKQHQAM